MLLLLNLFSTFKGDLQTGRQQFHFGGQKNWPFKAFYFSWITGHLFISSSGKCIFLSLGLPKITPNLRAVYMFKEKTAMIQLQD